MMIPFLHCCNHHQNTTDQTQWIQEKWDLTFRMMWQCWMLHYPVWLIEVEEDLFITSFTQLYQSTRMMMLRHVLCDLRQWNHRNTPDQTQGIQEKWDLTFQMIRYYGMHNHPIWLIGVEVDLFLTSFFNYTNQREWWCSAMYFVISVNETTETLLTKLKGYKRSEIWHCKWFGILKRFITQFDWLKLRKIYFSLHSLNYTYQREWWCRIETTTTNINRFKRFQLFQFKRFCWLECLTADIERFQWFHI